MSHVQHAVRLLLGQVARQPGRAGPPRRRGATPRGLRPAFYLLARPNGAGKSTLYRAALASGLIPADLEFVDADLHEAQALIAP